MINKNRVYVREVLITEQFAQATVGETDQSLTLQLSGGFCWVWVVEDVEAVEAGTAHHVTC